MSITIILYHKHAFHDLNTYPKRICNNEVSNATKIAIFIIFLYEIHFLLGHVTILLQRTKILQIYAD